MLFGTDNPPVSPPDDVLFVTVENATTTSPRVAWMVEFPPWLAWIVDEMTSTARPDACPTTAPALPEMFPLMVLRSMNSICSVAVTAPVPAPLAVLKLTVDRFRVTPLATILHHLDSVWSRRHLPNVAAFHYADYEADLVGELRRLATALGIDVAPARAGELARHATLDAMRARSAELSPDLWESHESVFRGGGTTTWREIFTEADNEHYRQRVDELVGPGVAAWAHGGRRGNDPDA